MSNNAVLALADGSLFEGVSVGAPIDGTGEVVFNTAMTGYQEILTDPSYRRQIVTLTAPHVGNTGVNRQDAESDAVHAAALVVRDLPLRTSSFRSEQDLPDYLAEHDIAAIAGVDTRRLTRHLRSTGAQAGAVLCTTPIDRRRAIELARSFGSLQGVDLAREVSTREPFEWCTGSWTLDGGAHEAPAAALRYHVVAYDFGIKRNILRRLVDEGCRVSVVPADTAARDVLQMQPDGVFLSNGPGDPEPCGYAIAAIRTLLDARVPIFGICLGHQLLALASGARTVKMKFGHHGANHPVQQIDDKAVMISSQNHGFAVDADSLPNHLRATHVSLFDGTLQGLERTDTPAFGFQGHPEASPGPHDLAPLFRRFSAMMECSRHAAAN